VTHFRISESAYFESATSHIVEKRVNRINIGLVVLISIILVGCASMDNMPRNLSNPFFDQRALATLDSNRLGMLKLTTQQREHVEQYLQSKLSNSKITTAKETLQVSTKRKIYFNLTLGKIHMMCRTLTLQAQSGIEKVTGDSTMCYNTTDSGAIWERQDE